MEVEGRLRRREEGGRRRGEGEKKNRELKRRENENKWGSPFGSTCLFFVVVQGRSLKMLLGAYYNPSPCSLEQS